MGIRAGDIQQFTWYGMTFDPAPETDVTMFLPGTRSESTANGNGTAHVTGRRVLGGFDGLALSIGPGDGKLEFLATKQATGVAGACSMTLIDGTTYGGALLPEGDLQFSTGNGQVTVAGRGAKWERL